MSFNTDRIETEKLYVNGLEIKKPKDPREYILSKDTFENTIGSIDKGEYLLNNEFFTFPKDTLYVLSSIETYLKFQEAMVSVDPSLLENKKVNVNSSIESYLKFWEATNRTVNYNYTNKTGFQQELLKLINDKTYFKENELETKSEFFDRIIDKGVVEFGEIGEGSKIVYSEILKKSNLNIETVNSIVNSQDSDNDVILRSLFDRIIDKGIVVRTYKGNLIISSVETYLKFQENINNNAVPA
jgi:hypothetical protein